MTRKHQKGIMLFHCEKCDFKCYKKGDYNRHLQTIKHNTSKYLPKNITSNFICDCGKKYKHRQSLYNHKKICKNEEHTEQNYKIPELTTYKSQLDNLTEMFKQSLQTNKELQDKLVEMAKTPTHITNIKKQTTFNLNNYLNINCKDAMNLTDFIEQIQLTLDDLVYLGNNGYVKSIENTFVKQLNNLEETKRPIHCTDKKRKIVYVKDTNKWEKDDEHTKLQNAFKEMNMKQMRSLTQHHKVNPTWMDNDANLDNNNKIIQKICEYNNETKKDFNRKVINSITTTTNIDK